MIPAVDDEAGRADQVHPLENRRLAGKLSRRDEQIRKEDERSARPAGNLDKDELQAQAASLRST